MYKVFCDRCEKKIKRDFVSKRFKPEIEKYDFEVAVSYKGVWNAGSICFECLKFLLVKALNSEGAEEE